MCLIIETRNNITIPKVVMEDMYKNNNDGYGFMYVRNGHTHGEKYQGKSVNELYDKYLELKEYEPYIHLRMKTHGDINEEQSHPFYSGNGIWLMHNGILNGFQGDDKTKSDTWYFNENILKPLFEQAKDAEALLASESFQILITRTIGSGNRIVLLDKSIGGLRFNDSSWHVIKNPETKCEGMKVSNTYAWSMHSAYKKPSGYYGGGKYYSGSNYSDNYDDITWPSQQQPKGVVIVPPGMSKSASYFSDPAGSFRDSSGELWIYTGRGWMMATRFKELYPDGKFPTVYEGQEATQSHPTLARIGLSDSSSNGTSQESEKLDASSANEPLESDDNEFANTAEEEAAMKMDLYQDQLFAEWGELDYQGVCEKVLTDPEGAADVISFSLGTSIVEEKE